MKVKDLIEQIKDYPDFEVELTVMLNSDSRYPNYETYSVVGLADIGHSSKVVVLDGE